LERLVHLDDEGVRRFLQDFVLADRVFEMVVLHQELLAEDLHGELLLGRIALQVDFEHLAKGALSKDVLDIERLEGDALEWVVKFFLLYAAPLHHLPIVQFG